VKNIVQIYAGENMSFAVDKYGTTYGWGENKHNTLLLDKGEKNEK
jgi:alpha-tubulin suppressor-like RCC1 family protein